MAATRASDYMAAMLTRYANSTKGKTTRLTLHLIDATPLDDFFRAGLVASLVEFEGDPPEPNVRSDIVAGNEECPHCGTIQDVIGRWVQGQKEMQYLGQLAGAAEDDDE